jgi:hypothetical protein
MFITWPVAGDNKCWLDSDGHLVYIYQEKFDEADIHDQVDDIIRRGFRKLGTTPSAQFLHAARRFRCGGGASLCRRGFSAVRFYATVPAVGG